MVSLDGEKKNKKLAISPIQKYVEKAPAPFKISLIATEEPESPINIEDKEIVVDSCSSR